MSLLDELKETKDNIKNCENEYRRGVANLDRVPTFTVGEIINILNEQNIIIDALIKITFNQATVVQKMGEDLSKLRIENHVKTN